MGNPMGVRMNRRRLRAFQLENSVTLRALSILPAYSAFRKTYALLPESREIGRAHV